MNPLKVINAYKYIREHHNHSIVCVEEFEKYGQNTRHFQMSDTDGIIEEWHFDENFDTHWKMARRIHWDMFRRGFLNGQHFDYRLYRKY